MEGARRKKKKIKTRVFGTNLNKRGVGGRKHKKQGLLGIGKSGQARRREQAEEARGRGDTGI